ncbi:MAG: sigma-70 family RNA polymerase sigma factor [Bacteroidales bacterium]|nr:sigma-70 family RNA polymerase sigma factor [Bacteroidales bacterium]
MDRADDKSKFHSLSEDTIISVQTGMLEHIGIVSRHWCRKNKLEIRWVVFNLIPGNDGMIYESILEQMPFPLRQNGIPTGAYQEYKNFVVTCLTEMLDKGFAEFNQWLIQCDNRAWSMVSETLKKYSIIWASTRNPQLINDMNELHFATLNTLFEKTSTLKLAFDNSAGLKSYYFRILENKTKEFHRQKIKHSNVVYDIPGDIVEDHTFQPNDLSDIVHKKIRSLEEKERYILFAYFMYGKKLNEIAAELNISPEHCRVIKYRALKQLINLLPKNMNDLI